MASTAPEVRENDNAMMIPKPRRQRKARDPPTITARAHPESFCLPAVPPAGGVGREACGDLVGSSVPEDPETSPWGVACSRGWPQEGQNLSPLLTLTPQLAQKGMALEVNL